jgi:processive 1,2-diacylglycerol beta-glucosyltransferase
MQNQREVLAMSAEARTVSARPTTRPRIPGAVAPRVLLLSSDLGAGHSRAAKAIELAILARAPGTQVRTLDFWSLMHANVADAVRQTYLRLVQEHPHLYERIYQLDERTWRRIIEGDEPPPPQLREGLEQITAILADGAPLVPHVGPYALDCALLPLLCSSMPGAARTLPWSDARVRLPLLKWIWARLVRRLERRLLAFRPDVVVGTQMIPAALLSTVKARRRLTVPSIAVPTDFGVHDFWLQPGTDAYCVAHPAIPGLPPPSVAQALITGVPLMPGFVRPPAATEARIALGLDPTRPVVLVLGGGLGLGVDVVAEQLLAKRPDADLVLVTGHNHPMRSALASRAAEHAGRLHVFGWTTRMEYFIRAADIVVGKPGGLTVAEVLACGRPLLASRSLGGQEGFNTRFLERHDVGRVVPEEELPACVDAWLGSSERLAQLKHNAWAIGARDGAGKVADIALEYAHALDADTATTEPA